MGDDLKSTIKDLIPEGKVTNNVEGDQANQVFVVVSTGGRNIELRQLPQGETAENVEMVLIDQDADGRIGVDDVATKIPSGSNLSIDYVPDHIQRTDFNTLEDVEGAFNLRSAGMSQALNCMFHAMASYQRGGEVRYNDMEQTLGELLEGDAEAQYFGAGLLTQEDNLTEEARQTIETRLEAITRPARNGQEQSTLPQDERMGALLAESDFQPPEAVAQAAESDTAPPPPDARQSKPVQIG